MSGGEKITIILLGLSIAAFVGAVVLILEGWEKSKRWRK